MATRVNIPLLVAECVASLVIVGGTMFLGAGTLAWPAAWVDLALMSIFGVAICRWLLRHDPGLLTERMTGFARPGVRLWDKLFLGVAILCLVGWQVVVGMDAMRFGWSHMPGWMQLLGGVVLVGSLWLSFAVFRANSFAAPAVRIQTERAQTVVTTGPYAYVRHPMYAGLLAYIIGSSWLLGSWWGPLAGLPLVLATAVRALGEERVLRAGLAGYADYMARVRWRFVPGIW